MVAWTPVAARSPAGLILIVDDDEAVRQLFRTTLELEGFDVVEAADGYEALRHLESGAIALVVLDVNMPGLAGHEVLQRIRSTEATVTLPVIVVTGEGGHEFRITSLDEGASDHMTKPVVLAELVARVRSQLRGQQAWQASIDQESESRAQIASRIASVGSRRPLQPTVDALLQEMAAVPDLTCLGVYAVAPGDRALVTLGELRPGGRPEIPIMPRGLGRFLLELTHDALRPKVLDETATIHLTPYLPPESMAATVTPLLWDGTRVGLLVLAVCARPGRSTIERRRTALSTAEELGVLAGAILGQALAERRRVDEEREALNHVIDGRMFGIALQPIVNMRTEQRVGMEALTRFHDGVPPDRRFGDAAALGLGLALEEATLAEAIKASGSLGHGWLSLNVSAELVLAGWTLPRLIQQARCPVVLELTEHAAVADYDLLRAAINDLPSGVRFAIDDAGAGYSSLRHIAKVRPSLVKLDQSLVQDIGTDPVSASLVAGMVHFAERTGIELVAEGVERPEDAETLKMLGVTLAQGYLFGRPTIHVNGYAAA